MHGQQFVGQKKELKILADKGGFSDHWFWILPSKVLKVAEDAHTKSMSAFDENEHLQQVKCIDCVSFKPDVIGEGTGIGQCLHYNNSQESSNTQPLFPNAPRKCEKFTILQNAENIQENYAQISTR